MAKIIDIGVLGPGGGVKGMIDKVSKIKDFCESFGRAVVFFTINKYYLLNK